MSEKMEVDIEFLWSVYELIEQIQMDDTGKLVGQIWMGGNGGLLSTETLRLRDTVMQHMQHMTIPVRRRSKSSS